MRDKEDRVRFSGYDVSMFKVAAFCLAAGVSGIGGAFFALQVGFMSPSFVGIVPSIELVILAAVGGRLSLVGAVYGALLVNASKTIFSESFPDLWLFLMAALFIGVTMAFPLGLAGLFESHIKPWWVRNAAERHKIRARLKELENTHDETPTLDEQNATASAMAVPAEGPDGLVMRRSSV
jgi:urea transport system permease protein